MTGLEVYQPLEPGPLGIGSRIRQELVGQRPAPQVRAPGDALEPPSAAELRFEGSGFKAVNEYATAPRRRRLRGDVGDLGRHDLVQGQARSHPWCRPSSRRSSTPISSGCGRCWKGRRLPPEPLPASIVAVVYSRVRARASPPSGRFEQCSASRPSPTCASNVPRIAQRFDRAVLKAAEAARRAGRAIRRVRALRRLRRRRARRGSTRSGRTRDAAEAYAGLGWRSGPRARSSSR